MRFSSKLFVSMVLVLILSFTIGGYLLVSSLFQASLRQEIAAALEENRMLRFSYETVLSSPPTTLEATLSLITQISDRIAGDAAEGATIVQVYSFGASPLYQSAPSPLDPSMLAEVSKDVRAYRIQSAGEQHYLQTACIIQTGGGGSYYLVSIRDISHLFSLRSTQFAIFRTIMLVLTLVAGAIVFLLSNLLTRPIRMLSRTSRLIANGALDQRAMADSSDEIGDLADDFNHMADEVERRILELEQMNKRQEAFIASFAHELKTPLTSIIGYADMLRSKKLDPETEFLSANYIFQEGKRLEALSLKLLELLILKRSDFAMQPLSAPFLLQSVKPFLTPVLEQEKIQFRLSAEEGTLRCDPDLFHTLLINLLDNARKAVEGEGVIQLFGRRRRDRYLIYVCDNGKGIAKEELSQILEPFYMTDKSRTRTQGGAGLGLSICQEIVKLHRGDLTIFSRPGRGTMVKLVFREGAEDV